MPGGLNEFDMYLASLMTQLPILVVGVLGLLAILSQRKRLGNASHWAVMGILLAMAASVLPIFCQDEISKHFLFGASPQQQFAVMAYFAVLWAILRATSYALLLVAIFSSRSQNTSAPSAPQAPGNRNPYF
ncbi:MAG: hypothetical protein U0894_05055 [Pirellulales bacterium]